MDAGVLRDGTSRLTWRGRPAYHLAFVSSFATHAVCPAMRPSPSRTTSRDLACLLGCGVTTGVLSVTRRANVRPGDAVAIFGCGGVGLSAVQGARLVSAHPVIAVDPLPAKRELALALGATDAIDPAVADPAEAVRALVPGGVDHAFEAIGNPEVAHRHSRPFATAAPRR